MKIIKDSLVGVAPRDLLINYGPTKLLVDNYHWHSPNIGLVASYTPKSRDVEDHFGVFRGVDQIESFAQAITGSGAAFLECKKHGVDPKDANDIFLYLFISIGQIYYHSYLQEGETFISIGHIKFYKFRQMVTDGRIYKVPKGIDLDEYFSDFTEERLVAYDLSPDFTLVTELFDITGRAIKIKK
ncbi:hypothetical protein SAMN05421813_1533 [Daejeonella rubra]|uniref:Uncharacterized protein n=1 Tax=Daejeonella rubra TaxID=990371 RepID=A0A1G9Z387_9SPHI|nr:hypothetical protein [Daejeonella rubra]SDN15794.1 hypothetical protein SAMN05421813_1533 [Daejeonella rubra]